MHPRINPGLGLKSIVVGLVVVAPAAIFFALLFHGDTTNMKEPNEHM
jgi:hypothetical protein